MWDILSRITTIVQWNDKYEHLVSCKMFGWVSEFLNLYDMLWKESLSFLQALQT